MTPLRILPAAMLLLVGCGNEYSYSVVAADRVDIHDVVQCDFEETEDGWEQYTCVPVFSAADEDALAWEGQGIGDFDISQREIFGAPFYQLWYTGVGAENASDIGYALSMDGVSWKRHPWNPVVRRGLSEGSFDRDDANVGCVAFDGDAGTFHLWYTGTNRDRGGTRLGHAVSSDGLFWTKDPFNPLDPLGDAVDYPISRVWGCDAMYEDGGFHFWIGGITRDGGSGFGSDELSHYDMGYLRTINGAEFEEAPDLVLTHAEHGGPQFDAEGVHKPSVFTFGDAADGDPRYWMLYAGYNDVIATRDGSLITYSTQGERLGLAASSSPDAGWERVLDEPVPLDFSGYDTADNPRAFFINGRVHVFFTDRFENAETGEIVSGIGLGISPFPRGGAE